MTPDKEYTLVVLEVMAKTAVMSMNVRAMSILCRPGRSWSAS